MIRVVPYASLFLFVLSTAISAQDAEKQADANQGVIRHVTLYRDRALVTREISVPPGAKWRTVNVPNLPELVVSDSVYADGDAQTIVRAVRVSPRLAAESQREEVRLFDQQLDELSRRRADVQHALEVAAKNLELLTQLVNFSVVSGQADLNRGVLNAETLTTLATYSMNQRHDLSARQFKYQQQLRELDAQTQQMTWKREQASSGERATNYQAKIFVETNEGQAGMVRLSYLVTGCGWSPQYTVRGRLGKESFELRYSGLVRQMSGEDWDEITLVLSTASPSVSAARPLLSSLRVTTVDPADEHVEGEATGLFSDPFGEVGDRSSTPPDDSVSNLLDTLRTRQRHAEQDADTGTFAASTEHRDAALNSLAGQMQQLELRAEADSLRMLAPDAEDDIASQVYTLPQPVSLDTRREQQLVQILETELAGSMVHVATPLLSTYAYREAEMTNTQPIGLLGGPATIYLDDRFVGRTQIPSTASGQRLTIGFGADQQVRTRRELIDKQDVVQGGNRQLKFVYRLVLANFKDQPVAVRLIDRMPNTQHAQQLSVRLDDPDQALSNDGLYQRLLRPTGILRWDLTVPKDRHGSQALDVNYSYTLEFDRSRIPTTNHTLAELQADYDSNRFPSGMGGFGGGGFGGSGN